MAAIRHKLRGIRIGSPQGDRGEVKPRKEICVFVAGKPDYHRDAVELFSFLFVNVPHGTMVQLLALISANLSWVENELAQRIARLPQSPAINRRSWGDEPTTPPPDLPQLDLFDSA